MQVLMYLIMSVQFKENSINSYKKIINMGYLLSDVETETMDNHEIDALNVATVLFSYIFCKWQHFRGTHPVRPTNQIFTRNIVNEAALHDAAMYLSTPVV